MRLLSVFTASVCLALTGCSTPQAILNQGVQGAKLSTGLEAELAKFDAAETQAADLKKQSLLEQRNALALTAKEVNASNLVSAFAGDARAENIRQQLVKLYQGVRDLNVNYVETLAKNDKTMADLLKPLPSTEGPLNELSKSFAEMGTELSDEARFDEGKSIIKTIQEGLKNNAAAAKNAQDAATNAQTAKVDTP